MKTIMIALLLASACVNDTERTACEIHADALCAIEVQCSGGVGTFEQCRAEDIRSCQVAAPVNDTVRAYACEEALDAMECSDWRHTPTAECDVTHWTGK